MPKFTSNPGARARPFHLISKTALLSALVFALTTELAHAGSATWKSNPTSNDWNTATNWMPRTVPNGPNDTATFAVSATTGVSLTAVTEVNGIVFAPGASPFTITAAPASSTTTLVLTGVGIANNSGVVQNFVTYLDPERLTFYNQATAGTQTVFTAKETGKIEFFDSTTAGSGTFMIMGNQYFEDDFTTLYFYDNSSAANGIFINTGGSGEEGEGGGTVFSGNSTAANGTFTNEAATNYFAYTGGGTSFVDNSTAADAVFTNEGGVVTYEPGGTTEFFDNSNAERATITCNGAGVRGAYPGEVQFFGTASAGSARLIAKGGALHAGVGGRITFWDTSDGGQARVELFDNGTLDLSHLTSPGLSVGSLAGDGIVLLVTHSITVGNNDLSTTFSGGIRGTGSLTKTGAGILVLSGESSYTGGTTIEAGRLLAENRSGSATGTGSVQVNAGVLGGGGIISGAVTLGTGSGVGGYLAPGKNKSTPGTLTIQGNVTFNSDVIYA